MNTTTAPNGHDFPITTEVAACILSGIAYEGRNGKIGMTDLGLHAEHLISDYDYRNLMANFYANGIVEIVVGSFLIDGLGYKLTKTGTEWLEQLA